MPETTLTEPAPLSVVLQPTQNKPPCYDGIPMESEHHVLQMQLLGKRCGSAGQIVSYRYRSTGRPQSSRLTANATHHFDTV